MFEIETYINKRTKESSHSMEVVLDWFRSGDDVEYWKSCALGGNGRAPKEGEVYVDVPMTTFTRETHSHLLEEDFFGNRRGKR